MAICDWPPIYFCSSGDEPRDHTQPGLLLKESSLSVQIHLHNSHTLFSTRADHRQFVQERSPKHKEVPKGRTTGASWREGPRIERNWIWQLLGPLLGREH